MFAAHGSHRRRGIFAEKVERSWPAQADDPLGVNDFDLQIKELAAIGDLGRFWVAIVWWAALQTIGDENIFSAQSNRLNDVVQKSPSFAAERYSLFGFIFSRGLADKHDVSV
jgi:hypothetical protein